MFFSASNHWLVLHRVRDRVLVEFGEVRDEIDGLRDSAVTQVARLDGLIDALQSQFVVARDIVLAVRAEVVAARGVHPSMVDRVDAIEERLDALESLTPP